MNEWTEIQRIEPSLRYYIFYEYDENYHEKELPAPQLVLNTSLPLGESVP